MTWLDRILWPFFGIGDAAYILVLIIMPLTEAVVSATSHRIWSVLMALVLAFVAFMLTESRLRLRLWQARCDMATLERASRPTVNLRVSRSQPSDWDDT